MTKLVVCRLLLHSNHKHQLLLKNNILSSTLPEFFLHMHTLNLVLNNSVPYPGIVFSCSSTLLSCCTVAYMGSDTYSLHSFTYCGFISLPTLLRCLGKCSTRYAYNRAAVHTTCSVTVTIGAELRVSLGTERLTGGCTYLFIRPPLLRTKMHKIG